MDTIGPCYSSAPTHSHEIQDGRVESKSIDLPPHNTAQSHQINDLARVIKVRVSSIDKWGL